MNLRFVMVLYPFLPEQALESMVSYKSQRRDADPDCRWDDCPQSTETSQSRRTGGEDVVNYEDVSDPADVSQALRCGECAGDIPDLVFHFHLCLSLCASETFEKIGPHGHTHGFGHS